MPIELTAKRVDGGRVLHGCDKRLEVKEGRGRRPTESTQLVFVVQAISAHCGQLPALGHEHDEQHEGRSGSQTQGQAAILVARLSGPQAGHGPTHAQRRGTAHGQAYVHGLTVIIPDVTRLDGQNGDSQQQTGRVHQRAQHVLVFGVAAVVQAVRPLKIVKCTLLVQCCMDWLIFSLQQINVV